jgi:hypothetical protein
MDGLSYRERDRPVLTAPVANAKKECFDPMDISETSTSVRVIAAGVLTKSAGVLSLEPKGDCIARARWFALPLTDD